MDQKALVFWATQFTLVFDSLPPLTVTGTLLEVFDFFKATVVGVGSETWPKILVLPMADLGSVDCPSWVETFPIILIQNAYSEGNKFEKKSLKTGYWTETGEFVCSFIK